MPAVKPHARHRGDARIMEHCVLLGRLHRPTRSPYARLEAVVGSELAHVLVHGLAGGPRREQAA
jgi:hypothetical protein